jgi:5-methylthioribose kinase
MTEAPIHQLTNLSKEYLANRRFNWNLCYQFAGVEIMRRIIGLAQLPFDLTLQEKEVLLKEAYHYIMKSR